MARNYQRTDYEALKREELHRALVTTGLVSAGVFGATLSPLLSAMPAAGLLGLGFLPAAAVGAAAYTLAKQNALERARKEESLLRGGRSVLGMPPERDCFGKALEEARQAGKKNDRSISCWI